MPMILVIGLGVSGKAAARFLLRRGEVVMGTDDQLDALIEKGALKECVGAGLTLCPPELVDVSAFASAVLSPGVPATHPLVRRLRERGVPVEGEIEWGCKALGLRQTVLGVTGTNGKTTVTLLATHVLNQAGVRAKALGNVGVPLIQEVEGLQGETVVLELSSYQLETLQQPVLDQAVLLNVTPDHLDRYSSMEAYAAAKCRIGGCLKPRATLFVDELTADTYRDLLDGIPLQKYGYAPSNRLYTDLDHVYWDRKRVFSWPEEMAGRKSHHLENTLAAYALCRQCGVTGEAFLRGLTTFAPPRHRIMFVAEKRGVRFYDDSKGTNLDAVVRGIETLDGPILLIAGGVDKGAPYTVWIEPFRGKVKWIGAIGQAAEKIRADLGAHFSVDVVETLEGAVRGAIQRASTGDIVLLSPGCASFDQFRDYAHRGEEFQRLVRGEK